MYAVKSNESHINEPHINGGLENKIAETREAAKLPPSSFAKKRPKFAKLIMPKLKTKSDYETNSRDMSREEMYKVSNDFKKECTNKYSITGSFALELHASKQNAPIHRAVHDVDFMVENIAALSHAMRDSVKFDIARSSLDSGEDNAWIVHNETGFIVDVVQAGPRFGPLREVEEEINGFRVAPLDTLRRSILTRGDNRGDIDFINSLDI